MTIPDLPPMDKTAITVTSLKDSSEEDRYWHSKTPEERMQALEIMRRMVYGEARTNEPMQKVIEVVDLEGS